MRKGKKEENMNEAKVIGRKTYERKEDKEKKKI